MARPVYQPGMTHKGLGCASPQGQTVQMSLLQIQALFAKPFSHILTSNSSSFALSYRYPSSFTVSLPRRNPRCCLKPFISFEASATPDQNPNSNPDPRLSVDLPKPKGWRSKPKSPAGGTAIAASDDAIPSTIPRKPRRSRWSEAATMEDFIRDRLEGTFTSIREQNAEVLEGKEEVLKQRTLEEEEGESSEGEDGGKGTEVLEEEDPDWPLDARSEPCPARPSPKWATGRVGLQNFFFNGPSGHGQFFFSGPRGLGRAVPISTSNPFLVPNSLDSRSSNEPRRKNDLTLKVDILNLEEVQG